MHSARWISRLLVVAVAGWALTGCPSLSPRAESPPSLDNADALARSGDLMGAGHMYEALGWPEQRRPIATNICSAPRVHTCPGTVRKKRRACWPKSNNRRSRRNRLSKNPRRDEKHRLNDGHTWR